MKPNLSETLVDKTVETLKADNGVQKKWKACADMWRADGFTSEMLLSDKEVRDAIKKEVVLLSFTKTEQAIAAKPHTARTDEEKVTARWIQTETGSRYGKIVRHVKKAEQEEAMTDDERGAKKVADLATRLKKDLTYWIEKVEKAEAVTFSATQMIKYLKDASALIK